MSAVLRRFAPGSEWIYFKLYCGDTTANRLLLSTIAPLVRALMERGSIDQWFFIRYADPQSHLRLRLHATDLSSVGAVIASVRDACAAEFNNGLVWKIQIDTYEREIERYGAHAIEMTERLFWRSSELALEGLALVSAAEDEDVRWQCALPVLDRQAEALGLSLSAREKQFERASLAFSTELDPAGERTLAVDRRFRDRRADVERALGRAVAAGPLDAWISTVERSIARDEADYRALRSVLEGEKDGPTVEAAVGDHAHMFCNRFFASRQREYERVLYTFLAKAHRSTLARMSPA